MSSFKSKSPLVTALICITFVLFTVGSISDLTSVVGSSMPTLGMANVSYAQDALNDQDDQDEQDEDPLVKAQEFIDQGKKSVKSASSRPYRGRSKRRVKKRVTLYFSALKSFSSALRILDEYEMEEEAPEYYQQIKELMDQVITLREVKTRLDTLESDLVKSVKTGSYEKSRDLAQELISLNERNKKVRYLLPILNDLLSDQ